MKRRTKIILWSVFSASVLLLSVSLLSVLYLNSKFAPDLAVLSRYIMPGSFDNISCYYIHEGNVLRNVDDPSFYPPEKSIFFHETSCKGGLTARQACAVESAARTHPQWEINVIFSGPIGNKAYISDTFKMLKTFKNVKFLRLELIRTIKNTPVEDFVLSGQMNQSLWLIAHTSDLLRCLTLYKWGGIYLDLDMIICKSLEPLGNNWAVIESNILVSNAVLAFSRDHVGRMAANASILNYIKNYRNDDWAHNGPGLITRILKEFCSTTDILAMPGKACRGFKVYGSMLIPSYRAIEFFEPGDIDLENTYMYHLWNKLSHNFSAKTKDSKYIKLAKKCCPTTYEVFGDKLTLGGEWSGPPQ